MFAWSFAGFLAGNVGNLTTASKLKQSLEVKSTATMQEYLSYLEQAYVISWLPKFSYSYKTQLANPRKAYFIDNGLQRVISPSLCDFVVCKNSSPVQLIQVCWQLSAENIARERDGLIDAMNFFHFEQGMIITFDQEDKMIVDEKIIDVVPFWKVFGR